MPRSHQGPVWVNAVLQGAGCSLQGAGMLGMEPPARYSGGTFSGGGCQRVARLPLCQARAARLWVKLPGCRTGFGFVCRLPGMVGRGSELGFVRMGSCRSLGQHPV